MYIVNCYSHYCMLFNVTWSKWHTSHLHGVMSSLSVSLCLHVFLDCLCWWVVKSLICIFCFWRSDKVTVQVTDGFLGQTKFSLSDAGVLAVKYQENKVWLFCSANVLSGFVGGCYMSDILLHICISIDISRPSTINKVWWRTVVMYVGSSYQVTFGVYLHICERCILSELRNVTLKCGQGDCVRC